VIDKMKCMFETHGLPKALLTNNGPPFNSVAFREFTRQYNFQHCTISPWHSQTNRLAERSIQAVKKMMKCREDNTDPTLAILNVRNTPESDAVSPAQRLFERRTRTLIPATQSPLKPRSMTSDELRARRMQQRQCAKKAYDAHARDLFPIRKNDPVRMLQGKTWVPAQIIKTAISQELRSCLAQTDMWNYSKTKSDRFVENAPERLLSR